MWKSRLFWKLLGAYTVLSSLVVVAFLLLTDRWQPGLLWLGGAGVLFALLLANYVLVSWILKPLRQLTQSAEAIAEGDFKAAVSIRRQDEIGDLARALKHMQDESAERLAQLQGYSQQLTTVLGSMVEGVVAVDGQKRVLLANDASRMMFDNSAANLVGRPLLELTRNLAIDSLVERVLAEQDNQEADIELPGNARRFLRVMGAALPGLPCPGVVLAVHDVTELRRLENMRRDFVTNVSHELKTPLASIKAHAETLRLGAINDPDHNLAFVCRIEEQAERLHQLIVDLLHLSRVELGKETFESTEVEIGRLVQMCLRQCAELSEAGGVTLATEPPSEAVLVQADPGAVQTILDNLVNNAIKYTQQGGTVTVRWRVEARWAVVEVADTGIGIAPADQERIFERFFRVDKARSREVGGTGLGLAIVKHLAQAFNGEVSLASEPGVGSTFAVKLPLIPTAAARMT